MKENNNLVTITRKIELLMNEPDKAKLNEKYQLLFDMRHQVFRAANFIVNHQYFNHLFVSKVKGIEGYEKAGEAKELIKQIYDTSILNSTYQVISKEFPDMPSSVRAALNMKTVKKYNADMKDVLRGAKTLSNHRFGMPIPFCAASIEFRKISVKNEEEIAFKWLKGIDFILRLGKDKSDNRSIVERVIAGEYKFCDSQISVDDKKLFLLLTVQFPRQIVKLDYYKIAATNLGMNCPVFLTSTDGDSTRIGSKEEFWQVRSQMQRRYSKLQADLVTAKSGHGRSRKMKALERLKKAEANFATTYNHKLSKQIVMYCVNHGIGTLRTENLLGAGKTLDKEIILRNWSYYQLQTFIEYKAKMYGIKIENPSPVNITRKCNCCKNIAEEAVNLKERTYTCINKDCNKFAQPVDIDENASLNVLETESKTKKEKVH